MLPPKSESSPGYSVIKNNNSRWYFVKISRLRKLVFKNDFPTFSLIIYFKLRQIIRKWCFQCHYQTFLFFRGHMWIHHLSFREFFWALFLRKKEIGNGVENTSWKKYIWGWSKYLYKHSYAFRQNRWLDCNWKTILW